MKAAVHERFGAPENVVEIREIEKPEPGDDEVLVRVRATSANIAEWYAVTGRPWIARPTMGLRRPKDIRLGVDYAGSRGGGGQGRDRVPAGRRGVRRAERRVCRVRLRCRADRAIVKKPERVDVRAGRSGRHGGDHRAAGASRQGRSRARPERADQRRFRRRRHVRRADREGARRRGDGGVQHAERRDRAVARRRSRDRLPSRGLHEAQRALRPRARHRRDAIVLRAAPGARAGRNRRRRRRAEGEPLPRADRPRRRVTAQSASRKPAGDVLPGQVQQGGHGDAARPRSRPGS